MLHQYNGLQLTHIGNWWHFLHKVFACQSEEWSPVSHNTPCWGHHTHSQSIGPRSGYDSLPPTPNLSAERVRKMKKCLTSLWTKKSFQRVCLKQPFLLLMVTKLSANGNSTAWVIWSNFGGEWISSDYTQSDLWLFPKKKERKILSWRILFFSIRAKLTQTDENKLGDWVNMKKRIVGD